MILYIRRRPGWINFITNEEVDSFLESYMGQELVIGDLALWSRQTTSKLLVFLENNPKVSVFSSKNVNNPVLTSRFTEILVENLPAPCPTEELPQSPTYLQCYNNLGLYSASSLLSRRKSTPVSVLL